VVDPITFGAAVKFGAETGAAVGLATGGPAGGVVGTIVGAAVGGAVSIIGGFFLVKKCSVAPQLTVVPAPLLDEAFEPL
jgi:hypothetical protein